MRTTSTGSCTMVSPLRKNMTTMVKRRTTNVMGEMYFLWKAHER